MELGFWMSEIGPESYLDLLNVLDLIVKCMSHNIWKLINDIYF